MPVQWYHPVLRADLPPPPVEGVVLLQATILLEGLALIVVGLVDLRLPRLAEGERALLPEQPGAITYASLVFLVIVTVIAVALRSFHLGSDLWLDEIITVTSFAREPVLQIVSEYGTSNNHLLNTLLVKFAAWVFGEHEWSVRLPAMIFGTASVPVLYALARLAFGWRESLGAALLLAVSYHHVFFSQNARGYIIYVFFSLLATLAFDRALRSDRASAWLLYISAMVLDFATLVISGYVLVAHMGVGLLAVFLVWRRGGPIRPLVTKLATVFAVTGFLSFQLYALLLPQVLAFVGTQYRNPPDAWRPFSFNFLVEVGSGLAAGLSPPLIVAALGGAVIGSAGFVRLVRRSWVVSLSLLLPGVFQIVQLQVAGLSVTPRLFLLWLPLAVLVFIEGTVMAAMEMARILRRDKGFADRAATAMIVLATAGSVVSLRHYYAFPKQPYRASLAFVEASRHPGQIVVVVHPAELGYRYYGPRYGVLEGQGCFYVRSVAELDSVLAAHPNTEAVLVTTLNRIIRIMLPDLDARIARDWVEDRRFHGTLGDGDVVVWKPRTDEISSLTRADDRTGYEQ
jgi:hypothetical protein